VNVGELVYHLIPEFDSFQGSDLSVFSPVDGHHIVTLKADSSQEIDQKIALAEAAFKVWRDVPAPKRGELVRRFGQALRDHKEELAQLVTWECGKILEEGRGEVQEMIDICDYAVGLSRQLYGLTIASERADHIMSETWHPLGPIGIISAFNFPVAVWSWNAALAWVCGDTCVWKPSEKTPLTALACQALFEAVRKDMGLPEGLSVVVIGERAAGEQIVNDPRLPLISATGSTRMGREVGPKVAARFGRSLLELGGNNAIIVTPSADLSVALPSLLFGSVGTAGQRCTSTRRIIAHESLIEKLFDQLAQNYEMIGSQKVGDPLDGGTLVGPLIDKAAYDTMVQAIEAVRPHAVKIVGGTRVREDLGADAWYVSPALVLLKGQPDCIHHETFAPLTYVIPYSSLEEAMEIHNAVPQGLSSSIMTTDLREAEFFRRRSDCGIANVNIGTSGAEIGGAFGGEKETGGGRESGSDSWRAYMRRQTSTVYFGRSKPQLAQGVSFDV